MAAVTMLTCIFLLLTSFVGATAQPWSVIYTSYNMTPSGCRDEFDKAAISLCAFRSFSSYQPFKYSTGECKQCPGDQVTNLTFGSEQVYFPRSHSLYSQETNSTTAAFLHLSRPLTPGTVIYLAITPLGLSTAFKLSTDTVSTVMFQFYIRFRSGTYGMNTKVNSTWGREVTFSPIDPFVLGQRTDMHVLVTVDRFVIYLNKVFCCEFMYRLPLSDVINIRYRGEGFVHELSL